MAKSLFKVPFGKYKGKDIEDIPNDYLNWLQEQEWFCDKFDNGLNAIQIELQYRTQHNIFIRDEEYVKENL